MITDEQVKAALKEFYDHDGDRKFDVREYMRAALEAADAAAPVPKHAAVCTRRFGPRGETCGKTILDLPTPPKEPTR